MNTDKVLQLCESIQDGMYFDEDLNGPDHYSCHYCSASTHVNYRVHGTKADTLAQASFTHDSDCPFILAQDIIKELS